MRKILRYLLFVLIVIPLPACADPGDSGETEATIRILTPEDGDTIYGTPLHVEVEVSGLRLVQPLDNPDEAEPGTGHVDVMLNGQDADMIGDETSDIPDVADGLYQLKVELSNADHTPIQPYAGDLIYITVEAARCR